jgi:hypothetical protein
MDDSEGNITPGVSLDARGPADFPPPVDWLPSRLTHTYVTKDSGEREEYTTGMVRDTQAGKARFSLLVPKGVPYEAQFLTRVAELMTRGIEKYGNRNWEKAHTQEELDRFEDSADRHLKQWQCRNVDEDHAAAVVFNLLAAETVRWKMEHPSEGVQQ